MSRKKLILSILLMIGMIVAGIVLPALWKAEKQKNHTADPKQPAKEIQKEGEDTASLPTLKYVAFEELQFFADTQINELKQQLSLYLKETGKTDITSVTFLPEQTTYPEGNDIMLTFALSDNTTLPVTCSTSTGAFLFGEEKLQISENTITYERETDDKLPAVTTEEIESLQEGGFADTPNDIEATEPEKKTNTKEVQP
ncbi:MAG: DUF5038 domain-containing protein [Blautia massiliensis]|uniref:DUF5038 domain-containing protein n=1 Tax=Blautia massiliensis (ex Durand et al. 2017) TaxID=1737424 RepID=UPI002430A8D5|nr:DUF5038 domain-containing protein [Blautia massiliensis (ex Durand et al. 2017)]MCI7603052.1 DUF5038 domain-containing protein [Blautia massiliensis (ex Durand et al. 2017)]